MPPNFRLCSVFQTTPCPSSARVAVNSTITKINILNIFASSFIWLCCAQPVLVARGKGWGWCSPAGPAELLEGTEGGLTEDVVLSSGRSGEQLGVGGGRDGPNLLSKGLLLEGLLSEGLLLEGWKVCSWKGWPGLDKAGYNWGHRDEIILCPLPGRTQSV